MKVYINGRLYNREDAKISAFDHGLLYGDGVFEGIRSYNRLVFKLKEHIDRLYESAHSILLKIPMLKDEMADAVIQTLKANHLKDAYIRLVVTRGEGDLGLDPRKCRAPNIIIITDEIELYSDELRKNGLGLITVATQKNFINALFPQAKTLNYLNNILAKIEAINSGFDEAIMLNHQGYVTECTGENIFILKDEYILTPPTYVGILKGITRGVIIDIATKKKIPCYEKVLTRYDMFNADESFITGTAAEIIPVVKIDGRPIGSGKPGPITLTLMREFRQLTKTEGVKY